VKFLAITATNLDEFFMIRVSTTLKKLREGIEDVAPDGYNTEQQLDAMRARAHSMLSDQVACGTTFDRCSPTNGSVCSIHPTGTRRSASS
jgi:polyphosphate kinase